MTTLPESSPPSILSVWDPADDKIDAALLLQDRTDLINKKNYYAGRPYILPLEFAFSLLLIIIVATGIGILWVKDPQLFSENGTVKLAMYILIGSAVPFGLVLNHTLRLQEELVLFMLCDTYHWTYFPDNEVNRTGRLLTRFPGIIDMGHNHEVTDQIWGNITTNETVNFFAFAIKYIIGYGKGSQTYNKTLLVFKLNRAIPVEFSLARTGFFGKFEETLKTESKEFNDAFRILGNTKENQGEIIKILSPSVMVRLTDFARLARPEQIYFRGDTMIMQFEGTIWKTKYTNFFLKVAIDKRDEDLFLTLLTRIVDIPAEMIKYID